MAAASDALEQARRHHEKGEFSQAIFLLEKIVENDSNHADAYCFLGKSLKRAGRLADAQGALESAIRLRPDFAEAHYQLGLTLGQLQRYQDSVGCFLQALAQQPHFPEAHFNLGISLTGLQKRPQAIFHFRQALVQHPEFAEAQLQLATNLEDQESWDEAMAAYRRFLEMQPDHTDARNRLGIQLARAQRFEEAMPLFQTVIRLRPDLPAAYHNIAVALSEQDRLAEALGYFDETISRNPDHGEAHKGKGMALLKLGKLPAGWAEYEWRLKCKDNSVPSCSQPMWDGSSLHGKTILLRAEQGFGDTLQFIRYAKPVRESGGKVVFDCPAALLRLLKNCPGIDQVVERGPTLPDFDVHAPLLSAPHLLKSSLETLPSDVPYLFADPGLAEHWRSELRASPSFNIGIAWQGNPRQWDPFLRNADKRRSISLKLFEPLARLPGVKLFSLQKGFGTEQLAEVADSFQVSELGSRLNDFMDTAAVMKNMDLVITVDSSPAHLAGGLGVPVWVPLPFISCWRWLTQRQDTPWYPTMRLFRQAERGNWQEVFSRMAAALHDELKRVRPLSVGLELAGRPPDFVHSANSDSSEIALAQKHFQASKFAEAEELLRHIAARDPGKIDVWYLLGLTQQHQNKLADAAESYRHVVSLQPAHVEGHTNLGIVLGCMGQRADGEAFLRKAVQLRPGHAKAHNNLGVSLAEVGRKAEALACWEEAVRLDPNYPEGLFNLAAALADHQRIDEAAARYEQFLQLKPDHPVAYVNLGWLRVEQGRQEEAVILLEHAIRIQPDNPDAYNNLGVALADLGRRKEALKQYRESLRRRPMEAEVINNMGTTLAALGRTKEALACYQLSLKLKPNYPEVHWHQALTYLQMGDMTRGWPAYEWRWRRKRVRPRRFDQPLWDGAPLDGKTILVWCEQGFGDAIQFIRYAPLVKQRAGKVIVECPAGLMALFASCAGIDELVPDRTEPPSFDVQVPLMSLPGIFGTNLATIPAAVPYLFAEEGRLKKFRCKIHGQEVGASHSRHKGLRIGIAWQGNPKHRWDRHRSFPLEHFQALGRIEGVQLYSLQKGALPEELAEFARRNPFMDLGSRDLADMADTAAAMQSLDLVITCDSAVAHLAGAIGLPVWVALSVMSDWRWMSAVRQDSPWYRTMRLFRQKGLGDWDGVFSRMRKELAKLLRRKSQIDGDNSPASPSQAAKANVMETSPFSSQSASFRVAVVIPTILRPSLKRAVQSVFEQRLEAPAQLLIGVDRALTDRGILDEITAMKPPWWTVSIFDPGYSTSVRHGGLHAAQDGGALRTILSYAANSRYVAYLDDDNWWDPNHLASLLQFIATPNTHWAFSKRCFVDPISLEPLGIDEWESVGPGQGVYREKFGGFVDPNTLLIDQVACEPVLRRWSVPLPGDRKGMSADRHVFDLLHKEYRGVCTGQATCFYRLNANDVQYASRMQKIQAHAGE